MTTGLTLGQLLEAVGLVALFGAVCLLAERRATILNRRRHR